MLRHSEATNLNVRLEQSASGVVLTIADNGCGLADGRGQAGHGLDNMRRRAVNLGGMIALAGNAPGLKITLTIPDPASSPA
jgi:signal transduction histidine kinase